jgi:hypothetical protein
MKIHNSARIFTFSRALGPCSISQDPNEHGHWCWLSPFGWEDCTCEEDKKINAHYHAADDMNLGQHSGPLVLPGQLCEHLTESAVTYVLRDAVGTRRIIPCLGKETLDHQRNIRIDRVENGFRVYYGTMEQLRNIEPRIHS